MNLEINPREITSIKSIPLAIQEVVVRMLFGYNAFSACVYNDSLTPEQNFINALEIYGESCYDSGYKSGYDSGYDYGYDYGYKSTQEYDELNIQGFIGDRLNNEKFKNYLLENLSKTK